MHGIKMRKCVFTISIVLTSMILSCDQKQTDPLSGIDSKIDPKSPNFKISKTTIENKVTNVEDNQIKYRWKTEDISSVSNFILNIDNTIEIVSPTIFEKLILNENAHSGTISLTLMYNTDGTLTLGEIDCG